MARRRRPRGQAQSAGYRRARREAARIQKKAVRQNTHAARLWARRVVDHYQTIAIEDFRPKFLAKSTIARKAADAAIGTAKRELVERGLRAGRKVVLVPPAYTTMTCSECGEKQARLGLAERTFRCRDCGYTADRDRNAARVILATAERGRAGADDVRHSLVSFPGASGVRSEPDNPPGFIREESLR
jgi:putative transposase